MFAEGLGTLKGYQAKIIVDPGATPRFCKARSVPYAMRTKVEAELDRLQEQGIIEPVTFSDWATPIVPVLKRDKSVRICGDFKMTVNRASRLEKYPIPKLRTCSLNWQVERDSRNWTCPRHISKYDWMRNRVST